MEETKETPRHDSNKFLTRRMLGAYLCAVVGAFALLAAFAVGWRPVSPRQIPSLGATVAQCEDAFGHPILAGTDMEELHRWSCLYTTKGWNIMVSFDAQRKAEQFIIAKFQFPMMATPEMSISEQRGLLEKCKGGSIWPAPEKKDFGLTWVRADNQVYAGYITVRRWLILMNESGMEKHAKSLNLQIVD